VNPSIERAKHPGKYIQEKLDERGWTQEELATILGRHAGTIGNLIRGKTGITPSMAVSLSTVLGGTAKDWLDLNTQYSLSLVETDVDEVSRRARLFELAPIRDMQRRGWIKATSDCEELEKELKQFYGVESIEKGVSLPVAAKRSTKLKELTSSEIAWYFRARQLAASMSVAEFDQRLLPKLWKKLRLLAAYPKEAGRLGSLLSEYGIRFVVIEPLPGMKIDGAAFWLSGSEPAIAVSIQHDRIDSFWFTVMHECAHIRAGDALSVDTELTDETKGISVSLAEEEAERLANDAAAHSLISKDELFSFISRVGPYYSKERVIQFAHAIKIHPGIIVGQLQYRKELGYSALRELLPKVRESVITTALTDGWNQMIAPVAI